MAGDVHSVDDWQKQVADSGQAYFYSASRNSNSWTQPGAAAKRPVAPLRPVADTHENEFLQKSHTHIFRQRVATEGAMSAAELIKSSVAPLHFKRQMRQANLAMGATLSFYAVVGCH